MFKTLECMSLEKDCSSSERSQIQLWAGRKSLYNILESHCNAVWTRLSQLNQYSGAVHDTVLEINSKMKGKGVLYQIILHTSVLSFNRVHSGPHQLFHSIMSFLAQTLLPAWIKTRPSGDGFKQIVLIRIWMTWSCRGNLRLRTWKLPLLSHTTGL